MEDVVYLLKLNGELYGTGDASYVVQLIEDYVDHSSMYGKNSVRFVIERGLYYDDK